MDMRRLGLALVVGLVLGVGCGGATSGMGGTTTGGTTTGGTTTGWMPSSGGILVVPGGTTSTGGFPSGVWPHPDRDGTQAWKAPGVPADAEERFAARVGEGAPQLIYPLDGSLHPSNLLHVGFHWWKHDRLGGASLFRVAFVGEGQTYRLYFACETQGACVEGIQGGSAALRDDASPADEWFDLATRFAGKSVQITVEEVDAGRVYRSAPITITFSPAPVLGALYYWTAAGFKIRRATFGADRAVDFITPKSATNDFACAGCHSVSRNGEVIAFAVTSYEGESVSAIQSARTRDPANPFVRPPSGATPFTDPKLTHDGAVKTGPTGNFGHSVALSPDGQFMAVNGIQEPPAAYLPPYLEIRDTQTGALVERYSPHDFGGSLPIMPEYSPTGEFMIATMTNDSLDCMWTYSTCVGGLTAFRMNPTTGLIEGDPLPVTIPAAGYFHYYPTWSPKGDYVAFVAARGAGPLDQSDVNEGGELYLVPSSGGPRTCPGDPRCVKLARGMHVLGKRASIPKFAPFAQGPNDSLVFITYTSTMAHGFLNDGGVNQLWMFGVDLSKLPSDPSSAPFWVPYQEVNEPNFAPYWALRAPCVSPPGGGCTGCTAQEQCFVAQATQECSCVPKRIE